MRWQKMAVTLLFLLLSIGGTGGVMLVGYYVIISAR